ncbi:MAG: hypothetical protein IJ740_09065 [Ruminococcus sp.]|nr:hypothetical protein [Ruminococcus sp.]MBR1751011.1 hypothetical protein [Ruminococcus sp.]
MNKEVTVTGMEVRTQVGDNLLVAQDELSSTAKKADSNFQATDIDIMHALLEPVSTVDGESYWYTDTYNVGGNGDALTDAYTEYDEDTALNNNLGGRMNFKTNYDDGFQTNYGITGTVTTANVAYGYIDYVFQLKANNTSDTAQDVVVKSISLTSGKADETDSLHAFRAAIFSQDITSTNPTANDVGALVTILSNEGADTGSSYFTPKSAISTNGAPTEVSNYNEDAVIGSATANSTTYFKVVVRLWLEGEDTNCNNTVFNTLTDNWALSLDIVMDGTAATDTLTTSAPTAKAVLTSATVSSATADTVTIDGIAYHKISVQLDGTNIYTADTTLYSDSVVYKLVNNNHNLIDVTNQCTLPTTARP